MKKRSTIHQLITVALFFCLILSFTVTYITDACLGSPGALSAVCYDGTTLTYTANPIQRLLATIYRSTSSIELVREYEYRLFGIVRNADVLAGKNGFLFPVEDEENGYHYLQDYIGQLTFTEEESAAILAELQMRKKALEGRGCSYLLVVLPNAQTVYSDYMPSYLGKISENTRLAALSAYMEEAGFNNYLDMTYALRFYKDEDLPLYNNTENTLNALGLYYTYLMVCSAFSPNAYEAQNIIGRNSLQFYRHYTTGRTLAEEAGLENVVKNQTVSLANETKLNYRVLYNNGSVAKTVRNDYGGIAASSVSSLLLQFSNNRDRLQSEIFFSNTFDFVTYQPDLIMDDDVYNRADPSVVVQFIYENQLSQLLPQSAQ